MSEFHPKATRTLHVGNISREVVPSQVHDRFKEFGEILEIDIKKPDYALVQFVDIKSVVRAIRTVDGEVRWSQLTTFVMFVRKKKTSDVVIKEANELSNGSKTLEKLQRYCVLWNRDSKFTAYIYVGNFWFH